MKFGLNILTVKVLVATGLIIDITGFGILSSAYAATINPISYNMRNGQSSSYNYWDKNYTGNGSTTTDGANLTDGLGDLTDGVIPTQNWNIVEPPLGGEGPYVGWRNINPTITFNFGSVVNIDSVTIYVDDSNDLGGVQVPDSVIIGSFNSGTLVDPPGSAPTSYTFSNLGFTGTSLDLTLNSRRASWIFLSEVEFEGTQEVPEPLTILGTLVAGSIGLVLKKKKG